MKTAPIAQTRPAPDRLLVKLMRQLAERMPRSPSGENQAAVTAFQRLEWTRDILCAGPLRRRWTTPRDRLPWPVAPGAYRIGDPLAPVAVCTLSSNDLIDPLSRLPGVAISGRLYTLNLGIERMLMNLAGNPDIRILLLCGKDSPIFQTAQGVRALWANGVAPDGRIPGALGHFPVLRNIPIDAVEQVLRRVRLIDASGTTEVQEIAEQVRRATRLRSSSRLHKGSQSEPIDASGVPIRSEIDRLPVPSADESLNGSDTRASAQSAFFLISVDGQDEGILCQRFSSTHRLLDEWRAKTASRIVRKLLSRELIDDLGHAAYLGGELTKAESALRLGLSYEQDRPLRP